MATKEERRKKLEEEYAKQLEGLEQEEDEEPAGPGGNVLILQGEAADWMIEQLKAQGYTEEEAEEIADQVEDQVDDKEKGKAKKAAAKKATKVEEPEGDEDVKDSPPPPRMRYFGAPRPK